MGEALELWTTPQPLLRGKPTQTTIESNKNMPQRKIRDQYGKVLLITKSFNCGDKPHKYQRKSGDWRQMVNLHRN